MPIRQTFNPKIGAWVKYEMTDKGAKWLDVKEKNPKEPFKNVVKAMKKKSKK